MLQIDFAMSYSCEFQNEIQSALWACQNGNLFTAAFFSKGKFEASYLFVTNNKDKGKNSVLTFLRRFFSIIDLQKVGENFTIFSDGPAAEFKNKYCVQMLSILRKEFGDENIMKNVQWNYSATSHGKGVVDGIGGRVKSLVRKAVMSKKNNIVVQNARDFANVASKLMEKTYVVYVDATEIQEVDKTLWDTTEEATEIRNLHSVIYKDGKISGFRNDLEKDEAVFEICVEKEQNESDSIGDWVLVLYDSEEYFGEIISKVHDKYEVTVMKKQLGGTFRWPEKPDTIFYKSSDLLRKIAPPVPAGQRGQFRFLS